MIEYTYYSIRAQKAQTGESEEMGFRYLIYKQKELEQNGRLCEGAGRLLGEVRRKGVSVAVINCQSLKEYIEEHHILAEEILVVAARDETLKEAKDISAAALGYNNPDFASESLRDTDYVAEGFEEVDYYFLERVYQRKHHIPWRVIETKRCYLREMTLYDLPDLYELYAGDGMTKYMEPLFDREEETEYTKAYIQNMYRFYGYGMWLVKDRMTHRLIGRAGLNHCEPEGECVLEMGYAIGVPYQKKGYAAEVCRAVIDYAKCADLGFDKLYCFVQPGNEASMALLHKLGFAHMGSCMSDGKKMCKYVVSIQ